MNCAWQSLACDIRCRRFKDASAMLVINFSLPGNSQ
jgi:hypothetical protein